MKLNNIVISPSRTHPSPPARWALLVTGLVASTLSTSATSSASLSTDGRIHPFGGNSVDNLCIEVASRDGGTGVNLQDCFNGAGDALQEWRVGADGHIQLRLDASIAGVGAPPYCLNVYNASQGLVDVETCDPNSKSQAWSFFDGKFTPSYFPGCLDVFEDNPAPGTWLDLAPCNGTQAQVFLPDGMSVQIFAFPSGAGVASMLDVKDGDYPSVPLETPLDIDQSNGTAAQYFSFSFGAGVESYQAQIQDYSSRQCLTWQLGADYNPAYLWPCSENNDAYWQYTTGGQFANSLYGCLDVLGANTANGTPVDVYDCNGTNAQKWHITLPGLQSPICKKNGVNVNCSSLLR